MTVLVTGATGALGRVLCAMLRRDQGDDVVAVARRKDANQDVAGCDVTDADAVVALVSRVRPRLVFHLAASFSNDYERDFTVNVGGARHLLAAIRATGLAARVVLLGTAAEYGVVDPRDNPIAEDHRLHPVSIYGVTKACQTHLAYQEAYEQRADVVVARMFNLLAPDVSDRLFAGRVQRLIERYARGEIDVLEVGNLDSTRDYIDADDAVVQLTAIAARGNSGDVYHVASGEPVLMRELLRRLLAKAGVPHAEVREAPGVAVRAGYDCPVIYADVRRTRSLQRAAA